MLLSLLLFSLNNLRKPCVAMVRNNKNRPAYRQYMEQQSRLAYEELVRNQCAKKAIGGALLGAMLGLVIFYFLNENNITSTWMLLAPAALVGGLSRLLGRSYQTKYAVFCGCLASLIHLIGIIYIFPLNTLAMSTLPVSFIIALYLGKVHLNDIQQRALWRKKIGQLD